MNVFIWFDLVVVAALHRGEPHRSRAMRIASMAALLLALAGCGDPMLPKASSKLLDPNGRFTLWVSNQSFAVDPVDVQVEIDSELVVSDYLEVGSQHTYAHFTLSLPEGKHHIRIRSAKGKAELETDFHFPDHRGGVITYWYYPKSHYNPTPRKFKFDLMKEPILVIM